MAYHDSLSTLKDIQSRAGRVPGEMIVLSKERTEQSRTIQSFRKKTNAQNAFLKILKRLVKERNDTERELFEKSG